MKLIALLVSGLTLGTATMALAAGACCPAPAPATSTQAALSPARMLLVSYERVANALASDDLRTAQQDARTFATVCQFVCEMPGAAAMENCGESIRNFIAARDIEKAREHFKLISADVIKLARKEEGFYVMTCPMAGENADWVQSTREIRNPYHGSRMLRCGAIKNATEASAPAASSEG
jgi:hypothetical protein